MAKLSSYTMIRDFVQAAMVWSCTRWEKDSESTQRLKAGDNIVVPSAFDDAIGATEELPVTCSAVVNLSLNWHYQGS